MTTTPDELETKARLAAFLQGLRELGWTDGRNLQIVNRWGSFSSDELRKHAAELAGLAPDVILAAETERDLIVPASTGVPVSAPMSKFSSHCKITGIARSMVWVATTRPSTLSTPVAPPADAASVVESQGSETEPVVLEVELQRVLAW
jgi:hypothetical protein